MDSDLIEKLLQTTGLSCDDLLSKLQRYRSSKDNSAEESSSCTFSNKEIDTKDECVANENNSVILETKSSSVDNTNVHDIHLQINANANSVEVTEGTQEEICLNKQNTEEESVPSELFSESASAESSENVEKVTEEQNQEYLEKCELESNETKKIIETTGTDGCENSGKKKDVTCQEENQDCEPENHETDEIHSNTGVDCCGSSENIEIITREEKKQDGEKYAPENYENNKITVEFCGGYETSESIQKQNQDDYDTNKRHSKTDVDCCENSESTECITHQTPDQRYVDKCESETNVVQSKTGTDCGEMDKNNMEEVSAFDIFKKRSKKIKISDYLENILNCQRSDRRDNEDLEGELDDRNMQMNIIDKKDTISSHSEERNETVNNQNLNMEREDISQMQCEDNRAVDKKVTDSSRNITNVSEHDCNSLEPHCSSTQEISAANEISQLDTKQETSLPDSNAVTSSEDNLRNILKMQLSSLRNMKKSSGYLPDIKKTSMFFHNLKKKRKSCDVNSELRSNTDDDVEESNEDVNDKKISSNENSVISLSDETDFLILNVTGGVDRMRPKSLAEANEERVFAGVTDSKNNTELLNDDNPSSSRDVTLKNVLREGIVKTYKKRMYGRYLGNVNDAKKSPTLTVKKNISENFKEDPGVNKSLKNSEKSPFVSDSLEDFLSESAQLKISYSIPKLGAEEGINESTKQSPFDNIVSKVEPPKPEPEVIQKEPKLVKAKTLAEMRRHFEKMKTMKTDESDVSNTLSTPLSRYKKRKPFKKFGSKIKEHIKENVATDQPREIQSNTLASHRNGVIMYNNKKLWVSSRVPNKCIGTINKEGAHKQKDTSPMSVGPSPNRKPSLLSSLSQNRRKKITYRPGPLCKKADLQNQESRNEWVTEVKTLPKLFLEVVPEVAKPVDPNVVHLLPVFDDVVISEERVNFALSVLKQKNLNTEPQSFNFYVPYNNKQEQMVVRKPCTPILYRGDSDKKETDAASDIASVLNDIITYVETKEIEPTLIKDDDIVVEPDSMVENTTKTKKQRRSKLDLELLRLSCKVIDVATNETQDKVCSKPFCRLGCVCKSLLCESVFSNHCQLVECMFGCKCTSVTSNEEAVSNNSLSAHTVNHLEDKAKKNLAKVEREFTQTFIHTDNDAILIGTAKMRRSSKPPKKYTDYVADDGLFDNLGSEIPTSPNLKSCSVVLQKLDMGDIVPFCLVHSMYTCPCKGQAVSPPPKPNETEQIPKIRIIKTKEDQHKAWFDSCARIRKVFSEYKERNKNPLYNKKLMKKNLGYVTRKFTDAKGDQSNTVDPINTTDLETVKKPNKRKQSFNIREDITTKDIPPDKKVKDKEFALQRRKKKLKPKPVVKDPPVYNPVFDGEIKVSLRDNEEMLRVIGAQHETLDYLRILPWTKLIQLFQTRKISIWTKQNKFSVLLCNTIGHFPPKNFIDIRRVRDKSEIIDWILSDNLPPDRPRELMHLILTPKKFNFLIAGYCLKKIHEKASPEDHEYVKGTAATDPLDISEVAGNFEEICVDEDFSTNLDNGRKSIQESSTEISNSASEFLKSRPKQQSVLKSTINNAKISPVQASFKTVPIARRIKIVRPEMWICKETVKDSKVMSLEEITATMNKTSLEPSRRYIKLKSVLSTVKLAPEENAPMAETSQNQTDADRLKSFLKAQNPTSTSTKKIFKNSNVHELILKPVDPHFAELVNEAPKDKLNKLRDPLQTIKDESTSSELLMAKSPPIQNTCKVSTSSSEKSTKKSDETSNKRRRADPLETDESSLSQQISKSVPTSPVPKRFKENVPASNEKTQMINQQSLIPSRSLKCTHKDMNNTSKTLVLTNKIFFKRKLFGSKSEQGIEIIVPLPKVQTNLRWRMIYLNSDFTFLTFTRANYSIKYTDLMDVVKMSSNIRSTITLRNKEFSDHYKHPQFGIFCVPDYKDRLFVGPFLATENHNIETLRYLQGRLIDTQIFNKMVGKKNNEKEPVWVYESSTRAVTIPSGLVIDITEDDDVAVVELDSDSSEETQQGQKQFDVLLSPPFVEELTLDELKSRRVNRYIMTNIPHLGYFGACQRDVKGIDVFWPNGSRGYRFPNVTFAKNVLTHYLTQIFCPIPQDFKINVIIMTYIDVQNNKPIDPKYFLPGERYFCGEFGIYEKNFVPDSLLKQNKISSIGSLIKTHEEVQQNDEAMIRIFGLFLMSNEELRQNAEPEKILQWAVSEMYVQKKLSENYDSQKTDLQNMIRINTQKLKEKRKEEINTNNKISETIQIDDSDDDTPTSTTEDTKPVFRKIYASGKIKTSPTYATDKDRSLLKSSWQSLFKSVDKEEEDGTKKSRPVEPVKISLNNSNIILNQNKLLIAKLK